MTGVPSPCTGVCRLALTGSHCVSCLRTLAEIAAWPSADEKARSDILAAIEGRKRKA